MLSVQRCREILGPDAPVLDSEVEAVRDQLHEIAVAWIQMPPIVRTGSVPALLGLLPEDDRLEFEERAALMEFDGGLSRSAAERKALGIVMQRSARQVH